jgi:signal transduction histidine kinase
MNEQNIKFNFDVSTFRLIGSELITDRITALVELVKNAYDANAENVTITFENVGQFSDKSKIIIEDDGIGMSRYDIQNKWMIIGTPNKRRNHVSPAPYNRIFTGKKGIGRFAVDKLGANLLLTTTQKNSQSTIYVENNWGEYETIEKEQEQLDFTENRQYFTDIENKYWEEEKSNVVQHGTTFEISGIREAWIEKDITRVYKELSKLISPYHKTKYPFNITICVPEIKNFENKIVQSFAFEETTTFKYELGFEKTSDQQESLKFKDGEIIKVLRQKEECGLLEMYLYYFDEEAKKNFRRVYKNEKIDGIKIYRDGILTTPFAENVDSTYDKKDLLGIDRRRWSGFFEKIDTHDLLGWIEISDIRNPEIIEATNRQGFIDNAAWKSLKAFIIEQISVIEESNKWRKQYEKTKVEKDFSESKDSFLRIRQIVQATTTNDPHVKENLVALSTELGKLQGDINKVQSNLVKTNKEKERVEDLLFSLVSIQTYAGMLSHIVRTMVGKIKRQAEFLYKWIPNPKYINEYRRFAKGIFDNMNGLDSAVDFLLRYSKDGTLKEDVAVIDTISHLIYEVYSEEFEKRNIAVEVIGKSEIIIHYNKKALEDIFDNLISNSLKAFKGQNGIHRIKISVVISKESLVIHYSNNGACIPEEERDRVFSVFYTTTADQGGAGLGLYIVKTRMDAIKGSVQIIENEFKPEGVTFELIIPFKGIKND